MLHPFHFGNIQQSLYRLIVEDLPVWREYVTEFKRQNTLVSFAQSRINRDLFARRFALQPGRLK